MLYRNRPRLPRATQFDFPPWYSEEQKRVKLQVFGHLVSNPYVGKEVRAPQNTTGPQIHPSDFKSVCKNYALKSVVRSENSPSKSV